jgi:hypothetical protein
LCVCVFNCLAVPVGFVAREVSCEIAPPCCIECDESLASIAAAVYLPKHLSYVDTYHLVGAVRQY